MTTEAATLDSVLEERAARVDAPADETPVEPAPQEQPAEALPAEEAPADTLDAVEGEEQPEEAPAPAVEAPHYWSAEQKARFAELPADLQAVLAEQEKGRESAVQKAQQAAAEARKAAEAEAQNIKTFATQAGEIFQRAEAVFNRQAPEIMDDDGHPDRLVDANGRPMRWQDVNWTEWMRVDPSRAMKFKALHDAEAQEMQRLSAARQFSEGQALKQHVESRNQRLAELNHDLADPAEGPRRQQALGEYLVAQGIPQDQLPYFSAEAMTLAYKAMRFDEAQAKAQARPAQTPPKPAPAPVRPVSTGQTSSSRNVIELEAKAAKTGDLEDVLAARRARKALKG